MCSQSRVQKLDVFPNTHQNSLNYIIKEVKFDLWSRLQKAGYNLAGSTKFGLRWGPSCKNPLAHLKS